MGLLAGNYKRYVHMSSTVSQTGKKTFQSRTQSEHEIKCLYFIISHISRFSWGKYLQCRKFLRYAELICLEMLS